MIGSVIGRYEVLGELGRGGMGIVYRGRDLKLGRYVVLKFPLGEASPDSEWEARILREAQALASVDHPNVCPIFEIGDVESRTYLVMPFIDGKNLRQVIEGGPIEFDKAIDLGIQIAEGMRAANEAGVVHRDIKPANIIITNAGQAKLVDFGLAKFTDRSALTQPGAELGCV